MLKKVMAEYNFLICNVNIDETDMPFDFDLLKRSVVKNRRIKAAS